MTFVRCTFLTLCFTVLLACVAPRICPAPHVRAQVNAGQPVPGQAAAPANPQPAYSLPPEKLAKAIAISRIRHMMDIGGGLWGLAGL